MLKIIFSFVCCFFCCEVFSVRNVSITVQCPENKKLTAQVKNGDKISLRNRLGDRDGVDTIHFQDEGVFSIILKEGFQNGDVQISDNLSARLCSLSVSKLNSKITLQLTGDPVDVIHTALYRQLAGGGYAFILAIGNNSSISIDSVKSRQRCKGQALALISQS